VIGINLVPGLFLLPLLLLHRPQLLPAALELRRGLRLVQCFLLARQPLHRDARVGAFQVAACEIGILIALQDLAVERHPVLHEIRGGHGGNPARTARRRAYCYGAQQCAGESCFSGAWHVEFLNAIVTKSGCGEPLPAVTRFTSRM